MQGIRLVAALLAALVICGTGIALAAQDDSESSLAASQPNPQQERGPELKSERTATSRTFSLSDGALETELYENPINYRDEGEWKPIDEGLEFEGKALTNGANSFDLNLPAKMGAGAVRLSEDGQWVSYNLLGGETAPAELQDGTASYQTPGSGPAFDLSGLANGVKEQIELTDPSQPNSFRFELDASAGLVPSIEDDGSLAIRDAEGKIFATLPAPIVSDSSPESVAPSDAVGYALQERSEGGWLLTLAVSREWLSSPDRVLPVTIDPTLIVESPTLDCTLGSLPSPDGWHGCGSTGTKELLAAYSQTENQPIRSFLRFNVGSVPLNSYLKEAALSLNAPAAAENTNGLQARVATKMWAKSLTWRYYNVEARSSFPWTTPGGDFTSTGAEVLTSQRGSQAGWWNFSSPQLTEAIQAWLPVDEHGGQSSSPNYGFVLKQNNETRAECEANSSNCHRRYVPFNSSASADTSVRPKLTLIYYPKAPAVSKITSPLEGTVTARRLKLRAGWSAQGTTGVTFQYRDPTSKEHGVKTPFQTIPSGLVRNAKNEPIAWPVPVQGNQSEPLYFDAAHALPGLQAKGGEIEVRALFDASLVSSSGYSEPVKARVDRRNGGPGDGSAGIGPGAVDLLSGTYTMSETDVAIPGFNSSLDFARSWNSNDARAIDLQHPGGGVLGAGWTPSVPVQAAGGSEWRAIKEVLPSTEEAEEGMPGYVVLIDLEGVEYSFEILGSGFVAPPETTGLVLSRTDESTHIALTDPSGSRTLFEKQSGSNEYKPATITQGDVGQTRLVYEASTLQLTEVIAPSPPGVECTESNATSGVGCRALTFAYQPATNWGAPTGSGQRLASITYHGAVDKTHGGGSWEVAKYSYDTEGRLAAEWDPRITPNLKETYTYRKSDGELATLTSPGEEPWSFEYYADYDGEELPGRLKSVKQASLLSEPATAQATVVYGVAVSGSGAPYDMSGNAAAQWGQQDIPVDATAIFPPDQVPGSPPSSYSRATLYYMDSEGQVVNTATPSGAGTSAPSIATSEFDEYGNVVRELSPQNRLRALAAGSGSVAKSHELETKRNYGDEGTEMQEEWGPMHQVRLESGEVVQARMHRTVGYDENEPAPPSGTPYAHMPTFETVGASIPGRGIDADQHGTQTKYNWILRKPTDTIVDPGQLNLRTHTEYDPTTGLPTETGLPASPEGRDAHTIKTIYYKATGSGDCEGAPAWANLPCRIVPAAQPGTAGQPELLSKEIAAYSPLGQPTEAVESPGAINRSNARITTIAYDAAGRELTASQAGGGASLPGTETLYNSANGMPEIKRFSCSDCDRQEVKTTYDKLGRPIAYEDADGNVSSASYDLIGRLVTSSDGKGIQTRTYDPTSGLLVKLEDSGAGTFTAAYDADGNMVEKGLPDGLLAKTTYDETGAPVHLSYEKKSFCSIGCTWLDFGTERSIYGQVLSQTSLSSSQQYSYDKAGRLTLVKDTPQGGGCTTRSYSFDADSNRTALTTRTPGIGGACDLSSQGTTKSYSYDAADRLIDSGIVYDNYGRITSLPGADAGGETLTTSYYSNDLVQSQTQGAITNTYQLDGSLRQRLRTQTGGSEPGTEVYHYAGGSDSPAWIDRGTSWSRSIAGIDGGLAAIQDSSKGTTLQLTNLHGDIVATASTNPEATKLLANFEFDEFGNPKQSGGSKYGWLGGKGRRTELPSGVIQMGVRSYVPTLGRFLSVDPVSGGSANAYDYVNADPVNSIDLGGTKPSATATVGPCKGTLRVSSPYGDPVLNRGGYGKFRVKFKVRCGGTGYVVSVLKVTRIYEQGPGSGNVISQSSNKPPNPSGEHWNGEWGNWNRKPTEFECLFGHEYQYTYEIQVQWASPAGVIVAGKGSLVPPGSGTLRLQAQQVCGKG